MSRKDYLIDIYKVEADKYNKTRDIQWKFNISMWTLLVFAIYSKGNSDWDIYNANFCLLISLSLFTLLIHVAFIYNIQASLKRSLNRMYNIAQYLIQKDDESPISWQSIEVLNAKVNGNLEYLQASITLILLIVFLSL